MLIEKILGNINEENHFGKEQIKVNFEWFELAKKRIKKTAQDGTEMGITVDTGFKDGDILAETGDAVYVVDVLPVKLIKVKVNSMKEMGRACFELGNRHLSPQINDNSVKVIYDEPTFLYMKKLGFEVNAVEEKFTDFIECKAHGHSHEHE